MVYDLVQIRSLTQTCDLPKGHYLWWWPIRELTPSKVGAMENLSYGAREPSETTPGESTSTGVLKSAGKYRLHSNKGQRPHRRMPLVQDEPTLVDSEGNPLPEEALASDRRLDLLFSIDDDEPESINEEGEMDFEDDSREIEEHLASLTDRPVEVPAKKARSTSKSSLAQQDRMIPPFNSEKT